MKRTQPATLRSFSHPDRQPTRRTPAGMPRPPVARARSSLRQSERSTTEPPEQEADTT